MKNWHNFLLLENLNNFTKLSIFDFDETIAFSDTITNVIDKNTGESFQATTQEELDKLGLEPDKYEFDFSPLDVVTNAVENISVTKILRKRIANPNTSTLVLTARKKIAEDDIHRVLNSFNITTDDLYIVGLDGQNKGEYVLKQIIQKYPNIKEIEFYDDSLNNIIAMQMTKEIAELEKFHIYHVEHGKPKLIK
jgi:hypothetical protein|tara:strand:- start:116 stop:697 length:582 start_codon:yes stop_codon:yes gene_type:complete